MIVSCERMKCLMFKWIFLLGLLGWMGGLGLAACTPPQSQRNLCDPTTGGFAQHPDWLAFLTQAQNGTQRWDACLQMSWHNLDTKQAIGASTALISINAKGELQGKTGDRQDPFTGLSFPPDKADYSYRFRVFLFPKGGSGDQGNTCTITMKQPDFDCFAEANRDLCWFFHELRLSPPTFTGHPHPIEDDPTLSCKSYLGTEPPSCQNKKPEICLNGIDDDCDGAIDGGPGCIWKRSEKEPDALDTIEAIVETPQGELYIVGSYKSRIFTLGSLQGVVRQGKRSMFIAKIDASGSWLWLKAYHTTAPASKAIIRPRAAAQSESGDLIITGYHTGDVAFGSTTLQSAENVPQLFIGRFAADGSGWKWIKQAESPLGGWGSSLVVEGKRIFVAGSIHRPWTLDSEKAEGSNYLQHILARFNEDGLLVWAKAINHAEGSYPYARAREAFLTITNTGCAITGSFVGTTVIGSKTYTFDDKGKKVFVASFNRNGITRWSAVMSAEKEAFPSALARQSINNETFFAITGVLEASQQASFNENIKLQGGDTSTGFFATLDQLGIWRSATALQGNLRSIQPNILHPTNAERWLLGGDLDGTLEVGGVMLKTEVPTYFLLTYDQPTDTWTRFLTGTHQAPVIQGFGAEQWLQVSWRSGSSLYLAGGHLIEGLGHPKEADPPTLFLLKNPHKVAQ